ncbi:hypothetical protein L486_03677 [Kwoniella mangroviensis CBS 10435]|uniref:Uncharacterized protein n=1 Tax=Kwoniella mangroviensis CBS 10435 TaxID=1331196 RepID=A0A1B9IUG5_9TREE|nr:hypothetical protein L486_03677 [Kwoniella mangroviensis CBS 10435]
MSDSSSDSDLELPLVISNAAEIFEAMEAHGHRTQALGRPPKNIEQPPIYDDDQHNELEEISTVIPNGSAHKRKVVFRNLDDFVKKHKKLIMNGEYKGKERMKDTFVKRMKRYITLRVEASLKRDRNGQIMKDKTSGYPLYMSKRSLRVLCDLMIATLRFFPYPKMSPLELQEAKQEIIRHRSVLQEIKHLKSNVRRITTLYAADVKGLLETCFKTHQGKFDIAVQTAAMLLSFFYTGARPGSILKTDMYPDEFSVWRDLVFKPARDEDGQVTGFGVMFTLKAFKGYHNVKNLEVTFNIKSTISRKYAVLDLGTMLLAHGLRMGVFGDLTAEDLYNTDRAQFQADEDYLDVPIFQSRSSRTSLNSSNLPLKANAANLLLRELMREFGIASGTSFSDTLYALRRGFATTVGKHLDPRIAQFFMGHESNSTMFFGTYNQANVEENLTEGVLGPEEHQIRVVTPLAYERHAVPTSMPTVTLSQALSSHPQFRHWKAKSDMLKDCWKNNLTHWMKVSPYKELAGKMEFSQASLPALIAICRNQLRRLVEQIKQQDYHDELALEQAKANERNWRTIQENRDRSEEPSTLAKDLQKLLIEQEARTIEAEVDEIDAIEDNEIEVDPQFEDDEDDGDEGEQGDEDGGIVDEEEDEQDRDGSGQPEDVTQAERDEIEAAVQENERDLDEQQAELDDEVGQVDEEALPNELEPAEPISDRSLDAKVQKQDLLYALVALENVNDDFAPCELCLADDTVPQADKDILWKTSQKARKLRHELDYHNTYAEWLRWWPFQLNDGRWFCPYCRWNCAKSSKKRSEIHLDERHKRQMPRGFHSVMMNPLKAREKNKKRKEELGMKVDKGTTRFKSGWGHESFSVLSVPGTFTPLDLIDPERSQLGLGLGLVGSNDIDYGTDLISEGLLDRKGLLKRKRDEEDK